MAGAPRVVPTAEDGEEKPEDLATSIQRLRDEIASIRRGNSVMMSRFLEAVRDQGALIREVRIDRVEYHIDRLDIKELSGNMGIGWSKQLIMNEGKVGQGPGRQGPCRKGPGGERRGQQGDVKDGASGKQPGSTPGEGAAGEGATDTTSPAQLGPIGEWSVEGVTLQEQLPPRSVYPNRPSPGLKIETRP